MLNLAKSNLSRNDLCLCGSGKKYKKCHLNEVEHIKRHIVGPGSVTQNLNQLSG
ncbi:MAG: hypothetical protein F4Z86_11535 [Gemmatimonadetes bacterium]|nr:hypothetical protein [Gemmatimonadota bacterium]MYB55710.1 hypothetical protein [Gemmatimonadota bacterium]